MDKQIQDYLKLQFTKCDVYANTLEQLLLHAQEKRDYVMGEIIADCISKIDSLNMEYKEEYGE